MKLHKSRGRPNHGYSGTRLYRIWSGMKKRCTNPNYEKYHRYGGRGIKFDPSWSDFLVFRLWAISSGYSSELKLDRKDNNGNYCPDNCEWSSQKVQTQNSKNSKLWVVHGIEYSSCKDAAEDNSVSAATIVHWCNGYTTHAGNFKFPRPNCSSRLRYEGDE